MLCILYYNRENRTGGGGPYLRSGPSRMEGIVSYLKVSANGRYFTRDGAPFFWMGDTIWPAVSDYTPQELAEYFARRREQGFTVAHIMLPWESGEGDPVPRAGDIPLWLGNNPATPNEAYFEKLDECVRIAKAHDILLCILACGGGLGTFVDKMKVITADNARAYGRWLGLRYRDEPGILWSNGFDMPPWMYEDVAREFAAGILEGDEGRHLLFYHSCGGTSSSHFHNEGWLAANFIQTWADYQSIHGMVIADYHRKPTKPVVHVEGAYEAGTEYPNAPISSALIRRQAYISYLSGGFHTYGHNDLWRKTPVWREAMDARGANQLTILKNLFTATEWWNLVPDQTLFERFMQSSHAAARARDGSFAILYFSHRAEFSIDVGKIGKGAPVAAQWVDPQNGERSEGFTVAGTGFHKFTSPAAYDDAILLLARG